MSSNHRGRPSAWAIPAGAARPALDRDLICDVCVVGAGIAGLSAAYELALAGQSVVVIEKGVIGCGETGRTTAHLSNAIDDRYYTIKRLHGAEGARICADSHTQAIARIESIAQTERIDCSFERVEGYLFTPPGDTGDRLEREYEAAREAGVPDLEFVPRAPLTGFDTGRCLRFGRQGQFQPLWYLRGLADAIERLGGRICESTEMRRVSEKSGLHVQTKGERRISADGVIIATNTPVNNVVAMHTKQAAYRTYVVGLCVPSGAVHRALYWDTSESADQSASPPYHYARLVAGGQVDPQAAQLGSGEDLLLVGGQDHKTGQANDSDQRWARLEAWARERFAGAGRLALQWSGQVWEPVDRVAFIGRNPGGPEHVYIATGDSGMGMTHGAIAGMLLRDLILAHENPWAQLYDPARIRLRSGLEFARENLNVAARYADWVRPGEISSAERIPPGAGAVVRHGLSLRAVYRDEAGTLHERSAVCPHLGCIVAWNHGEQTWDCPCHGSRFDAHGELISGPAVVGLSEVAGAEHLDAAVRK